MTKAKMAIAVVLAACGGKKEEKQPAKPADPDPTAQYKVPAPKDEPKPAEPAAPDFTHGYCHVTGSGAVTFDQKTAHTGGSVLNVMQWHTEEMRTKMGFKPEGMILNCLGKDVRLNILSKQDKAAFPMKPATYTLGRKGTMSIMGSVAHESEKNGLSLLVQDGTLEITAFDATHIAGKGTATAKTMPDKGEVTLTFDFDMQCRGLSGCPK